MPQLKYLFKNSITPDYRMLRSKTIECISIIGLAVGKEKVRFCFMFISINLFFSLLMIVMK